MDDISQDVFRIISIGLLIILVVVGVFMNITCMISIYKTKELLSKPSIVFVFNLLALQTLQCLLTMIPYAIKLADVGSHDFRLVVGDMFNYFSNAMFYGICHGMMLMAIDRISAMLFIRKYKKVVTRSLIIGFQTVSNTYIFVLSAIPFMNYRANKEDDFEQVSNYNKTELWSFIMITVNGVIPYFVIVVCYVVSFKKAKKCNEINALAGQSDMVAIDNQITLPLCDLEEHSLVSKFSLVLTLFYTQLFLPNIIYQLIETSCQTCVRLTGINHEALSFGLSYLTYLNVFITPIVIWRYHTKFESLLKVNGNRNMEVDSEYDNLLRDENTVTSPVENQVSEVHAH